ncbi:hypothetical protein scyTo_0012188 [Scyliorhinus torazame]|uniref:Uncharacterized protein n=1 Tax=Scyliorhinus torazame TaxID=75743 RepID=A0A401P3U9_SCYTO|nr:hypothetical protein [Scyliorhinus torazame]
MLRGLTMVNVKRKTESDNMPHVDNATSLQGVSMFRQGNSIMFKPTFLLAVLKLLCRDSQGSGKLEAEETRDLSDQAG